MKKPPKYWNADRIRTLNQALNHVRTARVYLDSLLIAEGPLPEEYRFLSGKMQHLHFAILDLRAFKAQVKNK